MTAGTLTNRRRGAILAAALGVITVIALVVTLAAGHGGQKDGAAGFRPSAPASGSASATTTATPPPGMATVALARLPQEARQVVEKIDSDASFSHRQDGSTFANRERRLPRQPNGYYREYTVATPGASDRGARRIILGENGELYYTADHYASFQWIQRGASP